MNLLYALLIPVPRPFSCHVGSLGIVHFKKGCYVYVGSANSGLWRIGRHFRRGKAVRWHIDWLTERARPRRAYAGHFPVSECQLAKAIAEKGEFYAKGFGASDSPCRSHLVYFRTCRDAKRALDGMGFMGIVEEW